MGKAIRITYSKCVFVALGIQHVMRMRYIIICGLPGCTVFFHIISLTAKIFETKIKLLKIKCALWLSLQILSETFLILRRNERDKIKNVHRSSCKVTVIIVQFQ